MLLLHNKRPPPHLHLLHLHIIISHPLLHLPEVVLLHEGAPVGNVLHVRPDVLLLELVDVLRQLQVEVVEFLPRPLRFSPRDFGLDQSFHLLLVLGFLHHVLQVALTLAPDLQDPERHLALLRRSRHQ